MTASPTRQLAHGWVLAMGIPAAASCVVITGMVVTTAADAGHPAGTGLWLRRADQP